MTEFIEFKSKVADIRHEERDGEKVVVCQSSFLKGDCVMNRILFPKDDVIASVDKFDNIEVCVGHPRDPGGKPISAKSRSGMAKSGIFAHAENPRYEDDRVKMDVVIYEEAAKQLERGQKALDAIMSGDEISTSIGVNCVLTNAKGKNYDRIATIDSPDHNAILFDETPAASTKEKTGLNVNEMLVFTEDDMEDAEHDEIKSAGDRILDYVMKHFSKEDSHMSDENKNEEELVDANDSVESNDAPAADLNETKNDSNPAADSIVDGDDADEGETVMNEYMMTQFAEKMSKIVDDKLDAFRKELKENSMSAEREMAVNAVEKSGLLSKDEMKDMDTEVLVNMSKKIKPGSTLKINREEKSRAYDARANAKEAK